MLASLEEKTKGLHLEELNLQKRLEDIQSELSGTQNVLANDLHSIDSIDFLCVHQASQW